MIYLTRLVCRANGHSLLTLPWDDTDSTQEEIIGLLYGTREAMILKGTYRETCAICQCPDFDAQTTKTPFHTVREAETHLASQRHLRQMKAVVFSSPKH